MAVSVIFVAGAWLGFGEPLRRLSLGGITTDGFIEELTGMGVDAGSGKTQQLGVVYLLVLKELDMNFMID